MKTKIILVSHGELSRGMAHSARMIAGDQFQLQYYGLQPGEHPSQIFKKIKKEVEAEPTCNFIIAVDVFGGSVCNAGMELSVFTNVRLIAGMNLPLVIELLISADHLTDEGIVDIIKNAQNGIKVLTLDKKVLEEKDFF